MRFFLSKYATAAHLAILAVAPLVLSPFCAASTVATALMWLSLFAVSWVLLAPSRRRDEMLHQARIRLIQAVIRDPIFWVLLVLSVFSFLRWMNDGIGLSYDAELLRWTIKGPTCSFFPGSAKDAGYLPFATCLASLILLTGCRHALGKKARIFFLVTATLGAAGSALAILLTRSFSSVSLPSPDATAYGIYFLGGVVALLGAFELRWRKVVLVIAFAAMGSAVGLCFFAQPAVFILYVSAFLVLLLICCAYAVLRMGQIVPFKFLAILFTSLGLPILCVMGLASTELITQYMDIAFEGKPFFDPSFLEIRATLSRMAYASWSEHPWLGLGLGAFPLNIRFLATSADWAILPPGQKETFQAWWQILAERGIIGALSFVAVWAVLFVTYIRQLIRAWGRAVFIPLSLLGPLVFALVMAESFISTAFLQPDVIFAAGSLFTLAISSFPSGEKTHGK